MLCWHYRTFLNAADRSDRKRLCLYKACTGLALMHFSWEKHLELSRNVAVASDKNQGMALALMGVALTMLATDLLAHELKASALPSSRA